MTKVGERQFSLGGRLGYAIGIQGVMLFTGCLTILNKTIVCVLKDETG